MRNALSKGLKAKRIALRAILCWLNGRVTRVSGRAIHWRLNRKFVKNCFHEAGEKALDRTRAFYHQHLGSNPANLDSLDATAALMKWAKQRRGFDFSQYRAQLWEFVVEIADAALWLGWLFPSPSDEHSARND